MTNDEPKTPSISEEPEPDHRPIQKQPRNRNESEHATEPSPPVSAKNYPSKDAREPMQNGTRPDAINESGTPTMQSGLSDERETTSSELTPSTGSPKTLRLVDEATSIPLSFINESSAHLLALQKSLFAEEQTQEGLSMRMEPNRINAICNCAKQIASLQRLKIEAYKALRK